MKNIREQKGRDIAKVARIDRKDDGSWLVPSMSGNGKYIVKIGSETPTCTCPDCENGNKCKHIYAVETVMMRETTVKERLALAADLDRQPHNRVAVDAGKPFNRADGIALDQQVNDRLLFLTRPSTFAIANPFPIPGGIR